MIIQPSVTPWLGFNSEAKEAAEFYVSVIPNSKIVSTVDSPQSGAVLVVEFLLGGLPVFALNVGQDWGFTNAFSLSVACETQEEIDRLWAALAEGGQEIQCGWLTDKFGLAWQIVPANVMEMWRDPDTAKSGRMFEALTSMVKLDKAAIEAAFHGS
jgi:predicted 3-demethylubiquinone-9 3-methyltransferase (glyoxalase superfamily)